LALDLLFIMCFLPLGVYSLSVVSVYFLQGSRLGYILLAQTFSPPPN